MDICWYHIQRYKENETVQNVAYESFRLFCSAKKKRKNQFFFISVLRSMALYGQTHDDFYTNA